LSAKKGEPVNSRLKFAILAVLAVMAGLPFALLAVVTMGDAVPVSAQQAPGEEGRWSAVAPGRVEPREGEYRISAATPGRIVEIRIHDGDKVAAGDLLVKLDDAAPVARLSSALADAALKKFTRDDQGPGGKLKQRYDADDALFDGERRVAAAHDALDAAQAGGKGGASEIEKAKAELTAAQDALPKLRASAANLRKDTGAPKPNPYETALAVAQGQVAEAQALLDQTRIRAPVNGTVLQVAAKLGAVAAPSAPESLAVIGDLSAMRVRAEVDARDAGHVKAGQKAVVRADAFPGKEFTGHVTSVAPGLTATRLSPRGPRRPGDSEILEVFVAFDALPPLPTGMRVDVNFTAERAAKH
jgi:HlyD family secretion protein